MKKIQIEVGSKFGRLTFLGEDEFKKKKLFLWCECECGEKLWVESYKLRTRHTNSCGCFMKKRATEANTVHGHAKRGKISPTYKSWSNMNYRCNSPTYVRYSEWGGRGITICERWRSYRNFFEDMGAKPKGKTLDRVDNDGNYEPTNCRWATPLEQSNNRRHRSTSSYRTS